MKERFRAVFAIGLAVAAFGFVACGDDDDDDGGGGGGSTAAETTAESGGSETRGSGTLADITGLGPETGEPREAAMAAGKEAAEAAGGPTDLPPDKTIGFLNIVGGIESADRVVNATEQALKLVGYKMVLCDGQGDPRKWVTCGNSLLNQGVDGIITTGVDPPAVAEPLRKAKAEGIPWISVAGETLPGYDGTYGPDDRHTGDVLSEYLIEQMNSIGGDVDIAVHDFPIPSITVRTEELKSQLKDHPNIKIAAETTSDAANLIEGTRKAVTDQITADPNLKGFWFAFDTAGQAGAQAVSAKFPGEQFPDRPLVTTFHADPATQELIRGGQIDAVADVAYDIGSWVGVDQMLEFFARDQKPSSNPRPEYPGVGDLYTTVIINKDNLPPEGTYVAAETDVPSFFESKWDTEFGAGGGG